MCRRVLRPAVPGGVPRPIASEAQSTATADAQVLKHCFREPGDLFVPRTTGQDQSPDVAFDGDEGSTERHLGPYLVVEAVDSAGHAKRTELHDLDLIENDRRVGHWLVSVYDADGFIVNGTHPWRGSSVGVVTRT